MIVKTDFRATASEVIPVPPSCSVEPPEAFAWANPSVWLSMWQPVPVRVAWNNVSVSVNRASSAGDFNNRRAIFLRKGEEGKKGKEGYTHFVLGSREIIW